MRLKKTKYNQFLLLLTFFYICWSIPSLLQNTRFFLGLLPQIFFGIVFTAAAGALLPLLYARKWLRWKAPIKRNFFLSVLSIVPALFFAIFLSGASAQLLAQLQPVPFYVLYALLSFPLTFALWMFAFYILPRLVDDAVRCVVYSAIFLGVGFFIHSAFQDILLALEMFIVGLMLAIAQLYHHKSWLSFIALYLAIATVLMTRQQYNHYPYWLAALSCALTFVVLLNQYRCVFTSPKQLRNRQEPTKK